MHEFWCLCVSACVFVHSFVLKLVCCCWSVGVTCVHVVLCVCCSLHSDLCDYIHVVHDGTCMSGC